MPAAADGSSLAAVVRSAIDGGLVPEASAAAARSLAEWLDGGAPCSPRRRATRRKKRASGSSAPSPAAAEASQAAP